jgi:hypothetical protein
MSRPNYPPARSDPRGAVRPSGGNLLGNPGSNMPAAPGFRNGPNRPGTF